MSNFFDRINTKKPQKTTINLTKIGDSHSIDLKKSNFEISVNLNWNKEIKNSQNSGSFLSKLTNSSKFQSSNIDLDLGCMYRLKNGDKGVIQALGNNFGNLNNLPYIALDGDDRTGENLNGETLRFSKPLEIELLVVFAFIYDGVANWSLADGVVTIKQPNGADIIIKLDNPSPNKTMCGIAIFKNDGANLKVEKLEKYYSGHKELDSDFGFNFNWVAGSK